jgi:predicted  nucleic acid-binding Zn-ribbon protein
LLEVQNRALIKTASERAARIDELERELQIAASQIGQLQRELQTAQGATGKLERDLQAV